MVEGRTTDGGPFPGFEVLDELGRGGMGVVYRARDLRRSSIVALKTLQLVEPSALYRFKQEFRGLADLAHPNLVCLYELHSDGERWFFTMELVEGLAFLDHVRRGGDLRGTLRQLAAGVAALHAAGKLHRDVKPSNVLVAHDGCVKLLDFGLAADLGAEGRHLSTQRHVIGTAAYMAPEQAVGRAVSPASDWYSVGVMIYEALTGELPFGGSAVEMLVEKQQRDVRPPSSSRTGIPADLDSLCVRLLARDPAHRPATEEILAALDDGGGRPAPSAAPRSVAAAASLVGRERHLEALADAFDALRARRPVTVRVHGSSGVGKSSLVQCFLDDVASRDDAVVLAGRCYERESVPYKALDTPIDELSRHLGRLPRVEADGLLPRDVLPLTRVFPVLRRVDAVATAAERGTDVPDPQELRRRAAAGLRELFARIGDRRPFVVFIDDAHWGDQDSATLLADVLRPPDPPLLLLLLAYRSEDETDSAFLREVTVARTRSAWACDWREVVVDPLTQRESQRLAESMLGGEEAADQDAVAAIARESRGNPFFVQELARYARSGADAARDVAVARELSLANVVAARLRALPAPARRLLDSVAAAGRPVDPAVAIAASDIGASAQEALASLRAAHLVRAVGGEREDLDVYHDRLRETALAELGPEALRRIHLRLATAMAAAASPDPERLAVHFLGAGDAVRASVHFAGAADRAAAALAFDHAAKLYQASLDHGGAQGAARRALLVKLAQALSSARRGAEAAQVYLEAARDAPQQEAIELRMRAATRLVVSGRFDEWFGVVGPILASIRMPMLRSLRFLIPILLWRRLVLRVRGVSFRETREEDVPPDLLLAIETSFSISSAYTQSDIARGVEFQTRHLLLTLRAGEPMRVGRALAVEGASIVSRGGRQVQRGIELIDRAERLVAGRGASPEAFVRVVRAVAEFVRGRWRAALELASAAEASLRDHCPGAQWELNEAVLFRFMSLDFLGRMRDLATGAPAALGEAQNRGDLYLETDLRTRVCWIPRVLADRSGEALADMDEAIGRWTRRSYLVQHHRTAESRCLVSLYEGDGERAALILSQAERGFRASRMGHVELLRLRWHQVRAGSSLAWALAVRDPVRRAELIRSAERDVRTIARPRAPWAAAAASGLAAAVAAQRGDTDRAVLCLEECERLCIASEMALWAASARRHRGVLVAGDAGAALVAAAEQTMCAEGVRNPARLAAMYLPGLAGGG